MTVPSSRFETPEESGDERGSRLFVELGGGAELLDRAVVHDRDRVGHRHRFLLVVRDVDEGEPELALDELQLELHLLAELEVECAERLVEQQHLRAVHERSRKRDALLLPAGQLARLALVEPFEPDDAQDLSRAPLQVRLGHLLPPQPERDVLEDVQVGKKGIALENRVDLALVRRDPRHGLPADLDRPGVRLLEAADHPQRRRLAAARRTEQREERARGDLQREVVDGDHVVEALAHAEQADVRRCRGGVRRWIRLGDRRHESLTATCLMRVYSSIEYSDMSLP